MTYIQTGTVLVKPGQSRSRVAKYMGTKRRTDKRKKEDKGGRIDFFIWIILDWTRELHGVVNYNAQFELIPTPHHQILFYSHPPSSEIFPSPVRIKNFSIPTRSFQKFVPSPLIFTKKNFHHHPSSRFVIPV